MLATSVKTLALVAPKFSMLSLTSFIIYVAAQNSILPGKLCVSNHVNNSWTGPRWAAWVRDVNQTVLIMEA
jgi:hypothetical protein